MRCSLSLLALAYATAMADDPFVHSNYTCNAVRPTGYAEVPIYCTADQGYHCEVMTVKFRLPKAHTTIWNSYGCGCDRVSWDQIRWSATKRPNGPRIWTPDFINSTDGAVDAYGRYVTRDWHGVEMRYGTELDISYRVVFENLIKGSQPYQMQTIERGGSRRWKSGRQIYELVTDEDRVFIMQAVSMQIDETQTSNVGLVDLPSRVVPSTGEPMTLPRGWSYRCRKLVADLVIRSSGTAAILQDEFYNNYMEENVAPAYSPEECVSETEAWRATYCSGSSGLLPVV